MLLSAIDLTILKNNLFPSDFKRAVSDSEQSVAALSKLGHLMKLERILICYSSKVARNTG